MANLFRQNPIAFVLATLAVLLAIVVGVEAAMGLWAAPPATTQKPPAASDAKMLPPLAMVIPEQAYPETASRPLFTPTRRPAPAADKVAGSMVKGQFILTGVIAVGDQRIAILREKTSGKVHRVERGKEVNGLTLATVDNDKVVLAQGGDQEELVLQVHKGAPVAAPAAAAAAATQPSGPFGPGPGVPTAPPVGVAGAQPVPAPANPVAAAPSTAPGAPAANPAQRSGFGPFLNPPPTPQANPSEATPMTPEELLARRRARRGQQQPNQ